MQNMFVITDGNRFIHFDITGKCKPVSDISLAETYPTKRAAENIRMNSITKALSRTYYVAEYNDGQLIQHNVPRPPKTQKKKLGITYHYNNVCSDIKWSSSFDGIKDTFDSALTRGKELPQELSDIENQIIDLEHFVENTSLNARDGYKIYRKLKELLNTRRRIKYEIEMVDAINNNRAAISYINNIQSVISNCLSNNEYKPRIFGELFTEGVSALDKQTMEING